TNAAGPRPDPTTARDELRSFVKLVEEAIAAAPQEALQLANTVTVTPGGKTFSKINDALKSITDASRQKQYVVQAGPGTYEEVVTCKQWVFLAGAGVGHTTITAPATAKRDDKGTVKAASNSAVQSMTILSTGKTAGSWATSIDCAAAVDFSIDNCNLETHGVDGTNLVTLAVDDGSAGGDSQVNVSYTMVNTYGDAKMAAYALYAYSRSYVHVMNSKVVAENGSPGWGGTASNESAIDLDRSTVFGTMSLVLADNTSIITAKGCKLNGPYSPGVVVNPDHA
ncbi:MAG TPA: hypothetical protein VND45_12235, partial [Thermoanaerobaculia bacterium]|nr:hypothetical protein [Thermoanaerobaculia bacterium]